MPSERISSTPENGEKPNIDLESAAKERMAELREKSSEVDPADHAEKRAEQAREVINKQEAQPEPDDASETNVSAPSRPMAFLDQHLNYSQTLTSVQRKLKPLSRNFSKVIHTPRVEKTSEALETTVARPSVIVGTTWTALIVGAVFYFVARHFGYALSGSELLFAFIVGALLGLVLEGLWRTLKHR
jgi:hypothetical protein